MPPKFIAIDPGKTTGWAYWDGEGFQCHQLPWFDFLLSFERLLEAEGRDLTVICESYTITMETLKKSRQNWSLEAIGVIKYLCHKSVWMDPTDLIMQSPGQALSFATRDKLEKLGWWVPGKQHGQDAARHLLKYAVDQGLIELQTLMDV